MLEMGLILDLLELSASSDVALLLLLLEPPQHK
jgi:hypothetical protein